jgi:hypothetical protein
MSFSISVIASAYTSKTLSHVFIQMHVVCSERDPENLRHFIRSPLPPCQYRRNSNNKLENFFFYLNWRKEEGRGSQNRGGSETTKPVSTSSSLPTNKYNIVLKDEKTESHIHSLFPLSRKSLAAEVISTEHREEILTKVSKAFALV